MARGEKWATEAERLAALRESKRRYARKAHSLNQNDPEYRARKANNARAWREENTDRARTAGRVRYEANRDSRIIQMRTYRQNHPDAELARQRAWRAAHPDKVRNLNQTRRARIAGNGADLTPQEWQQILDDFDHRCAYCHTDEAPLQMEHVLPVSRGGRHTRSNVVPACGACNRKKGVKTALEFRMGVI